MPLQQLGKMRPLFLVALLLCWNAVAIALSDQVPANSLSLILLGCAALTLAILSAAAKRAGWARQLVLQPETEFHEVSPALFFIKAFSLLMAAWVLLKAWELTRS